MARSTFLPNIAKNTGGSPSRNKYDHTLSSNPTVARPFTWSGVLQTTGSSFNLATQGCSDAKAKELWQLGYIDF